MPIKIMHEGNTQKTLEINHLLMELADTVLKKENLPTSCEVSLVFCDNSYIQELNKDYRQRDVVTDVLSFPQFSSMTEIVADREETILLGDIVISLDKAREQAKEYQHTLEREIAFLFIHGLLHLLGYDHTGPEEEKDMRQMEERILKAKGLRRDEDEDPKI